MNKDIQKKEPIFNLTLFKRLLVYIQPYIVVFFGNLLTVVIISFASAFRPYILKQAIDNNIILRKLEGFLPYIYIMIGLLIIEAVFQLLFIFYAAWLGQSVVKDIRVKLFNHMLKFKMAYYDNSSVGLLITRAVTDMERIADVFGQGLFMIFRDILTMLTVSSVMMYLNFELSLIVFLMLPIILYATKLFQKFMKKAFEEVRT
jgi:subfamily B ATP-binding cassette protein MsbA